SLSVFLLQLIDLSCECLIVLSLQLLYRLQLQFLGGESISEALVLSAKLLLNQIVLSLKSLGNILLRPLLCFLQSRSHGFQPLLVSLDISSIIECRRVGNQFANVRLHQTTLGTKSLLLHALLLFLLFLSTLLLAVFLLCSRCSRGRGCCSCSSDSIGHRLLLQLAHNVNHRMVARSQLLVLFLKFGHFLLQLGDLFRLINGGRGGIEIGRLLELNHFLNDGLGDRDDNLGSTLLLLLEGLLEKSSPLVEFLDLDISGGAGGFVSLLGGIDLLLSLLEGLALLLELRFLKNQLGDHLILLLLSLLETLHFLGQIVDHLLECLSVGGMSSLALLLFLLQLIAFSVLLLVTLLKALLHLFHLSESLRDGLGVLARFGEQYLLTDGGILANLILQNCLFVHLLLLGCTLLRVLQLILQIGDSIGSSLDLSLQFLQFFLVIDHNGGRRYDHCSCSSCGSLSQNLSLMTKLVSLHSESSQLRFQFHLGRCGKGRLVGELVHRASVALKLLLDLSLLVLHGHKSSSTLIDLSLGTGRISDGAGRICGSVSEVVVKVLDVFQLDLINSGKASDNLVCVEILQREMARDSGRRCSSRRGRRSLFLISLLVLLSLRLNKLFLVLDLLNLLGRLLGFLASISGSVGLLSGFSLRWRSLDGRNLFFLSDRLGHNFLLDGTLLLDRALLLLGLFRLKLLFLGDRLRLFLGRFGNLGLVLLDVGRCGCLLLLLFLLLLMLLLLLFLVILLGGGIVKQGDLLVGHRLGEGVLVLAPHLVQNKDDERHDRRRDCDRRQNLH
ncbi:hypothetical protein PFISCL1PPCAC_1517, partial [Pristionchus fissidentatus]